MYAKVSKIVKRTRVDVICRELLAPGLLDTKQSVFIAPDSYVPAWFVCFFIICYAMRLH